MSRSSRHVPMRTCISCGTRRRKEDLLRLAIAPGGVVTHDARGRMPGRGAYICDADACRARLAQKGRLNRAFKTRMTLSSPWGGVQRSEVGGSTSG